MLVELIRTSKLIVSQVISKVDPQKSENVKVFLYTRTYFVIVKKKWRSNIKSKPTTVRDRLFIL